MEVALVAFRGGGGGLFPKGDRARLLSDCTQTLHLCALANVAWCDFHDSHYAV